VVTESITLEGIALGPFKIQLELNKLDQLYSSSPYRVIALEPNPAATDSAVSGRIQRMLQAFTLGGSSEDS
jgi:hypothetical protein